MKNYPSNVSDSQWQFIIKYLNHERKRKHNLRDIFNVLFYVIKAGCQWRSLPHDFPDWRIVYYYFRNWYRNGTFHKILKALVRKGRRKQGRSSTPSAAIMDSQSVKSTFVSSRKHTGFDAGKKVKGIKRHIIVDTLGNLLAVVVHPASMADRKGGQLVLSVLRSKWPGIKLIYTDGGYPLPGKCDEPNQELCGYPLQVVKRSDLQKNKVSPKRWVVERFFAWLDGSRRNAKSYERLPEVSEAMIVLTAIKLNGKI